jgi:phosphoribosylformimino-5-aminoimidazole carboxamide ribotide isomerase
VRAALDRRRRVILLPAIDIRGGKAVRLEQGDFGRETVYSDAPLDAARRWVEQGARYLHVVDLDGARTGAPAALDALRAMREEFDVEVGLQFGGGLRSAAAVREALRHGADRVVIGTAAYRSPEFLDAVLEEFARRVLVAVDVRGGRVSVAGWTEGTELEGVAVIEQLQSRGVTHFVYTNVDRDGTLEGIDAGEVRRVAAAVRGRFIYSGGIASLADLEGLRRLGLTNLGGVISGKALYEGRFGLAEGQAALDGPD